MEITATIRRVGGVTANVSRPGNISTTVTRIGGSGTSDYEELENKPSINGVELVGDKSTADLLIDVGVTSVNGNTGDVTLNIPTVPTDVSAFNNDAGYITENDIPVISVNKQTGDVMLTAKDVDAMPNDTFIPTKVSQLSNDSGFITGINSTDVTNALGFTPYNATNPSGYVNASGAAAAAPVQSVNGQTGTVTLTIPTVPTDVSAFNNDAGYVTASTAPVTSVNGQTGDVTGLQPAGDYAASAAGDTTHTALKAAGIMYGECDNTSTSTAFTATVPGVTSYYNGLTILLYNGVVTSASGFTININGLGALPSYNNMTMGNPVTPTAPTRDTTIFNINYAMLISYSDIVSGGCWIMYRGYDANTNTIAYQVRTNSSTLKASQKFYRYRLLFTSADNTKWVPANTSTSTNATASREVNQTPIDPFGDIVYYSSTTAIEANASVSAGSIWQQYNLTLGYSFNRTGAALVLSYPKPIYIKCAPQTDGSAIIDSTTPYVTALPTTNDGKIYIYLGRTYSATQIELTLNHPVYYHNGTGIRLWTGG